MILLMTDKLTTTFFVIIRIAAVLLLTPIEAIRVVPVHIRFVFIFSISLLIASHLSPDVLPKSSMAITAGALAEFCNGLILSLSLYAAFAVFQIAGQLLDSQMGLNAQAIINPTDHSHEPLSGRLLMMLATLFFFTLGGHRQLFLGLCYSFQLIPPGKYLLFDGFTPVIHQFSFMFILALMIASPIVFGLMLIDMLAGILTRNMPQLNTFFLILPVKILLGLFLLMILLSHVNPMIEQVISLCFQTWKKILS